MSCKYNNCKHCGYKSECEIYKENADLELKIKKLTQHLEPQAMSALFEQVEEEVKQEQKIKELEQENGKLEGKLSDLTSEYYELENIKNNENKALGIPTD